MRILPDNIPLPEAHIAALILGALLHTFLPWQPIVFHWSVRVIGVIFVVLGVFNALWAIAEAGETRLSSPQRIVKSGPFAFSRHPMYVSWTLIYFGVMLLMTSFWLLVLFLPLMIYMHFFEILKEERDLLQKFGAEYAQYKREVRRYL
jgi:protein-S-isoprenylcysteine O-methyltransferase Ste14